ncbi:hypothetical protein CTI14_27065, partial [Methylobacterium radiotolerans]
GLGFRAEAERRMEALTALVGLPDDPLLAFPLDPMPDTAERSGMKRSRASASERKRSGAWKRSPRSSASQTIHSSPSRSIQADD